MLLPEDMEKALNELCEQFGIEKEMVMGLYNCVKRLYSISDKGLQKFKDEFFAALEKDGIPKIDEVILSNLTFRYFMEGFFRGIRPDRKTSKYIESETSLGKPPKDVM